MKPNKINKLSKRNQNINDFKVFYKDVKVIFEKYAKNEDRYDYLESLFKLNICPGGRFGSLPEENTIEVFFGSRPYKNTTYIDENGQEKKKLDVAYGATLLYRLTDHGHVECILYPAKTENERPIEDLVFLDFIKSPSKLLNKSKSHWESFISYMETTCIDGNPSITQKIRVSYIKNFKQLVVDKKIQETKSKILLKGILKYTATVGLSGFLILVFSYYKDKIENRTEQEQATKLSNSLNELNITTSKILLKLNDGDKKWEIINNSINLNEKHLDETNIENKKVDNEILETLQNLNKNILEFNQNKIQKTTFEQNSKVIK